MSYNSEQTPQARFLLWINQEDWQDKELLDWCAYGSGRGRFETAPADFMLDAILSPTNSAYFADKLAKRISDIVSRHPDLTFNHPCVHESSAQLCSISAYLRSPDILAEPFWIVEETLRTLNKELPVETSLALRLALIYNPPQTLEQRLQAEKSWISMIQGQSIPAIIPCEESAMDALLLFPPLAADSEEADPDLIGRAFKAYAQRIAADKVNRFQRFKSKIDLFRELWTIDYMTLLKLSEKYEWIDTVDRWNSLAIAPLAVPDSDESNSVIWLLNLDSVVNFAKLFKPIINKPDGISSHVRVDFSSARKSNQNLIFQNLSDRICPVDMMGDYREMIKIVDENFRVEIEAFEEAKTPEKYQSYSERYRQNSIHKSTY